MHDRVHESLNSDFRLYAVFLQRLPVLLHENFCILDLRAVLPPPPSRVGGIEHVEEDDSLDAGDILYIPEDSLRVRRKIRGKEYFFQTLSMLLIDRWRSGYLRGCPGNWK
jgi:hypothetical protein